MIRSIDKDGRYMQALSHGIGCIFRDLHYLLLFIPLISFPDVLYGDVLAKKWFLVLIVAVYGLYLCYKRLNEPGIHVTIKVSDLFLLSWGLLLLYNSGRSEDEIIIIVAGLMAVLLISRSNVNDHRPILIMACFGIMYSLFAFIQLLLFLHPPLKGVFANSGIFADYLASNFPILIGAAFAVNDSPLKKYLSAFAILVSIIVVVLTNARIGILAALMGGLFTFSAYHQSSVKVINLRYKISKRFYFLALLLIPGAIWLGLKWKEGSALGRALIYMVTCRNIQWHSLLGNGTNSFQRDFLNFQSGYFREEPGSSLALYADNTNVAFNEYLQIWFEQGILGFVLILASIGYLFAIVARKKTEIQTASLKGGLLAICICGLFSYPLRDINSAIGVIFIVGLLCAMDTRRLTSISLTKRLAVLIFLVLLTCSSLISGLFLKEYDAHRKWTALVNDSSTDKAQIISGYQALHPVFFDNGSFLFNYGAVLTSAGEWRKGLAVLESAGRYQNDINLWINKGDCYVALRMFKSAEACYLHAHSMIPNRFYPLHKLLLLYKETGEADKLRSIAGNILSKRIKVPSPIVDQIRREAEKELQYAPVSR